MSTILRSVPLAVGLILSAGSAGANVITDWDVNAVAIVPPSAAGLREIAIMHVAMFDAVNSIDRRYRPYMVQLAASKATSQKAAATSAAAGVLVGLHPEAAAQIQAASATPRAMGTRSPGSITARRPTWQAGSSPTATNAMRASTRSSEGMSKPSPPNSLNCCTVGAP